MAAMLKGGAPFHQACQLVGTPAMAGPFAKAFRMVGRTVEMGRPINEAMHTADLPPSFRTLVQVGAAGGELESALATAAEWHEARAERLDHELGILLTCISLPLVGLMIGLLGCALFAAWGAGRDHLVRQILPWA
jgi:type II secretory pathway component PulF